MVKKRSLILVENNNHNRIHPGYFDTFVCSYQGKHFDVGEGDIVQMNGALWIEAGYETITALNGRGLYSVVKKERSPRTDEQLDIYNLERVLDDVEPKFVFPADGCN